MPYSEISSRTERNYTVTIDSIQDIAPVNVLQRVTQEGENRSVSYVISCSTPYVSIDCDQSGLQKVLGIVQYIIDNPVAIN